jgi:epoxyqueuosine reductase
MLDGATKERIRSRAIALGFDVAGFAAAGELGHAAELDRWLDEGRHGEMEWMARNASRRKALREVMPEARSVMVVGLNYHREELEKEYGASSGVVARYARARDYHRVIEKLLQKLAAVLKEECGPEILTRHYVDTGPVLEREWARMAGLGWQGKSTVLISKNFGTWLLLGEILTSAELAPDPPAAAHCGRCTRCMDVCPTQAITSEYRLDARKCISYLTIELKGSIPEEFRAAIGNRVFGCDDCLAVCPWNRFAQEAGSFREYGRRDLDPLDLPDILAMDEQAFEKKFAGTPIKRLGLSRLKRNAAVVLGNIGGAGALEALEAAAKAGDPMVAEHALWAMASIRARGAATAPQAA